MSDGDYRVYGPEELGKDGYPAAWGWIKHEVRERAGHRCVRCGHPYRNGEHGNGEWSACDELCTHGGPFRWRDERLDGTFDGWQIDERTAGSVQDVWELEPGYQIEARWRILTVHHLDGRKEVCYWRNLVPLCQRLRCHLQVQGKVVMDRPWPWDHTSWFRPYVAAFYAFKYLGEELGREETESRLDELLSLGKEREALERMPF